MKEENWKRKCVGERERHCRQRNADSEVKTDENKEIIQSIIVSVNKFGVILVIYLTVSCRSSRSCQEIH